jgi:hypothetical protein
MNNEYSERINNIITKINELPEENKNYLLDIIEGLLNIKEVES